MKSRSLLARLLQAAHPYRSRMYLSFLCMIGTAITETLFPKVLQIMLDDGFGHKPGFALWMVPAALISLFVVRGLCTFSAAYLSNWAISRVLRDLRRQMFVRLLHLPVARFAQESAARMMNTMVAEARQVVEMFTHVFLAIVRDGLIVIGLLGYLFLENWRLTIVTLILVPCSAALARISARRLRKLNRSNQQITEEMTQVIDEAARGHQVIRIFSGEAYESKRFEQRSDTLLGFSRRITVAAAATVPINQLLSALAVSAVVMIALHQSKTDPSVTAGSFAGFMAGMLMLLAPLKRLAEVNGPLQRGLTSAEAVYALIDSEIEANPGTHQTPRAQGKLAFEEVHFTYPNSDNPALRGISLTIAPGETVALVGASGGGKSTLAHLAARFYAPDTGRILLDDVAYPAWELKNLRTQISLVSQNVVLFNDTLAANIAYGVEEIDQARLQAAVQAAYLQEVVDKLPQGLQTEIGDNGMRLSGGQRQRVAIARAIYKNAPLLILDEATSALDNESERAVQAALDRLMSGCSTLVIAHRLSTIERADRILVVEGGRIVEAGRHQELLAQGGVYANLYHLQFRKEQQA
ncbi:lipid A export permease/ATP-binding protein MsbA [Massilia sp. W12]|uniref:lipid A export permease/ATP-binding protein MsbA n=1 Tax=Massilia sp. W12 TaxID=3126507 RepID=UPI0030CE4C42